MSMKTAGVWGRHYRTEGKGELKNGDNNELQRGMKIGEKDSQRGERRGEESNGEK